MNRAARSFQPAFTTRGATSWTWDEALLRCSDAALAGVVFVAPLFMGGRHPVGKFVYVLLVCVAAAAWCLRQCVLKEATWRKSGAEWLILAGALLLLVQLAALPVGLLGRLSPGVVELLPLWQADADVPVQLGSWRTLSLTPRETRAGLVIFLAHALLFLTVVQRIQLRQDVERLLGWLALACAGMAALGLLQYFAGNGKFLWIYTHPSRTTENAVKGAFHNQNHLANFLALGIGALLWLTRRRFEEQKAAAGPPGAVRRYDWKREAPSFLLAAALAGVGLAGLLTYSRGGVVALLVAVAVCVGIYAWKKLLGPKSVIGLGVVGVAASIAILGYGYEPLMRRLGTFQEAESLDDLSHARMLLWKAMLQATERHPVLGAGVGSHLEVYPTYLEEHVRVQFSHGENGYLQVLLETGVVGLGLLATGMGVGFYWCLGALRRGDGVSVACVAPVLGGLAASAAHSVGDFVWYIPGCMSLTVILLALACRLHQLTAQEAAEDSVGPSVRLPRWAWIGATAVVLALSLAMVKDRWAPALAGPHWDRYIALSLRAAGKSVWSSREERIAADSAGLTERLMEHLDAALARDPDNARANYRMAVVCLRMFDIRQKSGPNAMDLTQIRDAALASNFTSREEQDRWLTAAVGENRRYLDRAAACLRRALRLCPLEGEAYIHLAEMAFLEGLGHAEKHALVEQAELLRPYEGTVLMAVGQEAALEGDLERALHYWKRAFHQDPNSQQRVVDLLAGGVSGIQFFELMEPDLMGLARVYQRYRELNRHDDAAWVGRRYAAALEEQAHGQKGAVAARRWYSASEVYRFLQEPEHAVVCLEHALRATPGDLMLRRTLGFRLLESHRYDEASEQFRWCLRHNPDDESAQAGLTRTMREKGAPSVARQPRNKARTQ